MTEDLEGIDDLYDLLVALEGDDLYDVLTALEEGP